MQMSYGIYRRFLVDLAYLKEPVVMHSKWSDSRKNRHF